MSFGHILLQFSAFVCSQGVGTDDSVLIELLASRTSEQMKDIIKVYKKGDFLICNRDKQKQV